MDTTEESNIQENKLEKIPFGFRLFAKQKLQKAIEQQNPSLILDPDTTYITRVIDTNTTSETLTDTLLKESIGEESLLSNNLDWLYLHSTNIAIKDQIEALDIVVIKNIVDDLSSRLINSYHERIDHLWDAENISIPEEPKPASFTTILNSLAENVSLIEKAYQVDAMYPSFKQTVVAYLSKKLKNMYHTYIDPSTVRVLYFLQGEENNDKPFLDTDLVSYTLNYSAQSTFPKYIKVNQHTKIPLEGFLQEGDILSIKSKHQAKLEHFWQKNSDNYRILAKFSYLQALIKQQNNRLGLKLSEKSLKMALQAIGFAQEEVIGAVDVDEIDLTEIPLDILNRLSLPNQVEVSSFLFNDQISSDMIKIRDTRTNDSLLYIPGYIPSFIEAKTEILLTHWVLHQAQLPDQLTTIASHFPHSSRRVNDIKLDAFLYEDYIKQGNRVSTFTQGDIFSFITERQKARLLEDLSVNGTSSTPTGFLLNYQDTDSAFFATIAEAIKYVPYLLPNIQETSSDLCELLPNPYTTASEFMKQAIKQKLGLDIDPDKIFIRFSLPAIVSPIYYDRTLPPVFTGRDASATIQSLTEAALNNYRQQYSPYGYTTIIYQDLSGKGEYTSSDQLVRISPREVEEIMENADLDILHKDKLDAFWSRHVNRVEYFIKHRFLQQSLEAHYNQTLSEENVKLLAEIASCSLALEQEELSRLIDVNISIEILSINSCPSTDIFIFHKINTRGALLYIAGSIQPFFAFSNYEECLRVLEANAKSNINWQKLLSSHLPIDAQEDATQRLRQGFVRGRTAGVSLAVPHQRYPTTKQPIEKSFFKVIQENVQNRSYLDANAIIISNQELIRRRIIDIAKSIEIALLVPSLAFPILNWASLAALATETAMNVYIAKNADTAKERHQAVIDAEINVVELLLIAPFISFRSLKFSKINDHSEIITESSMAPTVASRGNGIHSFLKKSPLSQEVFFGTTKPMQVWNIAAPDRGFSYLDVKAWFLDEKFLLFTGKTNKAKHLIISSHGGYLPGSGIIKVPVNVELIVLGPHGWGLTDPETTNILRKLVLPYGIINENTAIPTQHAFHPAIFSNPSLIRSHTQFKPNIKQLAGTNVPGHIKNYSLSKYQTFEPGEESYLEIVNLVNRSRNTLPIIHEVGIQPVDVLTVRNRKAMLSPNLGNVFQSLGNHGIHYDRITLAFCRSKIPSSLNPSYIASTVG